jgi:hypothetical protein
MSKNMILVPKKLLIENKSVKMPKEGNNELYKYFLSSMITYTKDCKKIITKDQIKNKIEKLQKHTILDNEIKNINIQYILDNLPNEYYDDYDKWSKIGMILSNSKSKTDLYNIFYEFSKKSEKFEEDKIETQWESFKTDKNDKLSIGTLIYWARKNNLNDSQIFIKCKKSIKDIVDNYIEKPILIENIPNSNTTILNCNKLNPDVYKDKIYYKLLCVLSEKGTGKTSNLLDSLFNLQMNNQIDDNTSILFISSRITFGFKLLGDLENHNFKLYSQIKEHYINNDRVICQLDSLMRLNRDSYDIIIIDECESLARYMTSSHFTKNDKSGLIVANLEMRISEAKQVFILDADLSNRCINYVSNLMSIDLKKENSNEYHIIQNHYKAFSEYNMCYMDFDTWLRKILIAVENNEKMVIASASNNKAKDILELIKLKFPEKKAVLIHKETSIEEKRQLLLNVNREWTNYDIVIYTPSVCMGVSFDVVNYFDNIYAYGCKESLGSQEFTQMLHRVRSPISKDIILTLDDYEEINIIEDVVNYNIVEEMLCSDYYLTNYDLHNNLIPKKIKKATYEDTIKINNNNNNNKLIYYPYKNEPIYDLYVRNSIEVIENRINFAASLFGYIKYKNYNLIYIEPFNYTSDIIKDFEAIKDKRTEMELSEKIEGIKSAPELTTEEYLIKIRLKDEFITKPDVFAINKYNLRNCYMLPYNRQEPETSFVFTDQFIEKYFDKYRMRWFRNISTILTIDEQTTEDKLVILKDNELYLSKYNSNCYGDFTSNNKYTFHKYPLDIINILKFDINDLSIKKNYDSFEGLTQECMLYIKDFKNEIFYKYKIRHTKDKNIIGTNGYYADKLLW